MYKKAKILALCLALLLVFPLVSCADPSVKPDENTMTVTFIDVAKGDCILIQKGDSAVLIDTGYDATASTVLYYLQSHGVYALDHMIITHYDKDHVGGAAYLINNLEVKHLLLPGYEGSSKPYYNMLDAAGEKEVPTDIITSDQTIVLEDVVYTVFASNIEYKAGEDGKEGNDNDCSLVVSTVFGDDSYLFAGDIEKAGINAFLKAQTGHYDIIKMPHHGSYEKNTEDLITAVSPVTAIITDSTGEPADSDLLSYFTSAGIRVLRSSVNGNITISGDGSGTYSVSTEK